MAQVDWNNILQQMLSAAQGAASNWVSVAPYAVSEFTKMEQDINLVQSMVASGQMMQTEAQLHIQMQQNSMKTVLLTVEGVGLVEAQQMIDAAIAAVSGVLNTALGFALL